MIPIPNYLKEIAEVIKQNKETLTMNVKCRCGWQKFDVYKNVTRKTKISKENRKKIKDSLKWYDNVLDPLITNAYRAAYIDYDNEGYREIIIYNSRENLSYNFDKEKYKSLIIKTFLIKNGEVPLKWNEIDSIQDINLPVVIKLKCNSCGQEYLIFDNRIHGNDAADFSTNNFKKMDFELKKVKKEEMRFVNITITIKNYWDFEEIALNGNEKLTFDDYSNMFSSIKIKAFKNNCSFLIHSEDLG